MHRVFGNEVLSVRFPFEKSCLFESYESICDGVSMFDGWLAGQPDSDGLDWLSV